MAEKTAGTPLHRSRCLQEDYQVGHRGGGHGGEDGLVHGEEAVPAEGSGLLNPLHGQVQFQHMPGQQMRAEDSDNLKGL